MLNELYDLAAQLKSRRVSMASWHRHFRPCPQGAATFLTLLDPEGRVMELQAITERERIAGIRKWEVENGVSFPAFNVLPLYEPQGNEAKKAATELRKALTSKSPPEGEAILKEITALIDGSASLWIDKDATRINKCVTGVAANVAATLGSPPQEFLAITELICRSRRLTADALHQQIRELLTWSITERRATAANWLCAAKIYGAKDREGV